MYKVCTSQQMRDIDKKASETEGIPSIILMENAGMRCVDAILEEFSDVSGMKIGIFCGKGNNGGDGFVIARHLDRIGALVDVFTVCGTEFSEDARINFNILENTGCTVMKNTEYPEYEIPLYDIVIDAIFGTGIKGRLEGDVADTVEAINRNAKYIVAVDVPSGMNSDTGAVSGACIRADMTVTFAAYKRGMFLYPGADFCGKIKCVDICIPQKLLDDVKINVIDDAFVKENFPKRKNNSQKGDYGKVLIIAGSVGMSGAAYLASAAALNAGCGLVSVACPEEINDILEQKTTEAMTIPLKSSDGHLSKECIPKLLEILPDFDAILFGPGLGRSNDIEKILESVAKRCEVPLIIDADGLYALAKKTSIIMECNSSIILTPHEMEMARLIDKDIECVINNRLFVSEAFSKEFCVTLILKGHHTVVTTLQGEQYINIKGNSGMATGGSGDVLAGIVASLAARGLTEEKCAVMSVFIHALAGDIAKIEYGEDSVTALRINDNISKSIKSII